MLSDPLATAKHITSLAEDLSYEKTHESPWTRLAMEYGIAREDELGGKEDDITAIVA